MRGLQKRRTCLSWQQPPTPRMWWHARYVHGNINPAPRLVPLHYGNINPAPLPPVSSPLHYGNINPTPRLDPPLLWKYQSYPQSRPPSTMEISILHPSLLSRPPSTMEISILPPPSPRNVLQDLSRSYKA